MRHRLSSGVFAAALGALIIAPTLVTAPAVAAPIGVVHQQPPGGGGDPGWNGFNNPGRHDPRDPHHNDWRCDRRGFWHNDQHDRWGHRDGRCHAW